MRIGGLATGMDTDQLVEKLMTAERMPLNKMQQDKQLVEWKRDGFRDVNKSLLELDKMMVDMKLSRTYKSKNVSSSQEGAVTATGGGNATDGSYKIGVSQLASNAVNVSTEKLGIDANEALGDNYSGKTYAFYTYNDEGKKQKHSFEIKAGDSLNDVLKNITDDKTNNVRAFYDKNAGKVIMETTRTGKFNTENADGGKEIVWGIDSTEPPGTANEGDFFNDVLKLKMTSTEPGQGERGGTDAKFTYNGVELTSKTNNYEINGLNLTFNDTTTTDAALVVTNDTDAAFDKIMKFVDKYNEVIDVMNKSQQEEKYRDFKPLTDEQKEAMTEDQIKKWEEKAKSGILRGESIISSSMFDMRSSWYSQVETGGTYKALTDIGLQTSANYMDGGKIVLEKGSEDKLRAALQDNPDDVYKLFSNSAEGSERGIVNRIDDALKATRKQIDERAGRSTSTLENYTLGKNLKDLNERITEFERKMTQVETRYWRQFNAMEKAVSRMNQQSAQLMQQFGGGM